MKAMKALLIQTLVMEVSHLIPASSSPLYSLTDQTRNNPSKAVPRDAVRPGLLPLSTSGCGHACRCQSEADQAR